MRTYSRIPHALVESWASRHTTHPSMERLAFHHHDVEEWLEVTRGDITFFTLSEQAFPLGPGSVFHIPRGEVHRADVGPEGVEYRMYVPIELTSGFTNSLTSEELDLLRKNLEFPLREENLDGRARDFFKEQLSDKLAFCRGNMEVVEKGDFLKEFTRRDRSTSGTLCVLNRSEGGLLLSTDVTVGGSGPTPQHFSNLRLFVKESGAWRCRLWVNVPQRWLEGEQAAQVIPAESPAPAALH